MTPDLDAIEARTNDCQTYNSVTFRNAEQLAHEDVPALLAYVRDLESKIARVRNLTQAAWDGELHILPGGYPSKPVEAFDLRAALEATK